MVRQYEGFPRCARQRERRSCDQPAIASEGVQILSLVATSQSSAHDHGETSGGDRTQRHQQLTPPQADPQPPAGLGTRAAGTHERPTTDTERRPPPRILVIDADALASHAIRRELEQAGATVIAAVACARTGFDLARQHTPDVVFVAGDDGVELIGRLSALEPPLRCVLLTLAADPEIGLAVIRAGGRGCIAKHEVLDGLARVVEAVIDDELVCSRVLATQMVAQLISSPSGGGYERAGRTLTTREEEIFALLHDRYSMDDIADRLVISRETVRTHVRNVMRKLGAPSRSDAIAQAHELRDYNRVAGA
jgi:two-component system nitrate/nitrite response regulator NarL